MPAELRVGRTGTTRTRSSIDQAIAQLAERQHGVITRSQLRDARLSRDAIHHRLRQARLHRIHRGVYAVGHRRLTKDGRWIAAVLAAGSGAVLSHRSAAALWGIGSSDYLEVTAVAHRARPGIHVHAYPLPPDEVTVVHAIPVTDVSRTLLDLAVVLPPLQLERAMNEAEVQRLGSALSLGDLVSRYPGRRGVAAVKSILARLEMGARITRSMFEDRFLSFVREAGFPMPRVNAQVLGFECDCVWHEQRVVVELDGHATHGTTSAFECDRARDRTLNANGWRTIRLTWRQLQDDAPALATDLRKVLSR